MESLYDSFLKEIGSTLSSIDFELLDVEQRQQAIKDANGNPTNEMQTFSSYAVEIPRGHGRISRRQTSVKVLEDSTVVLDSDKLNEGAYQITFSNLTVSYLDSQRHTLYLRAEGYVILDLANQKVVARRD